MSRRTLLRGAGAAMVLPSGLATALATRDDDEANAGAITGWKEKDDRTIAEMCEYMELERLDAFIPTKTTHLAYLLNYFDYVHAQIPWEEMAAALAVPRNGHAFAVGDHYVIAGNPKAGLAPWWLKERYHGGRPGIRAWEKTASLIAKKGLDKGRIGIERKTMPVAIYDLLRNALPDAQFVSADLLVPQMRFIKTKREVELLRKAANLAILAMEAYMNAIRNGASRQEAECVRAKRAIEEGGEFPGGPYRLAWTGGNDETPAWWDKEARERFLSTSRNWRGQPDDAPCFITHFEGLFQYYWADLAWHEFYGPEPALDQVVRVGAKEGVYREARRDFEIVRRVQIEALNQIRPGMDHVAAKKAIDAFRAADAEAKKHITNYYIHGVGLEIHEEPVLTGYVPTPIPLDGPIYFRPGAVVSSEWFTHHWTVEEPFVMTETGWEPLIELRGLTASEA
jgi:Xaa-Pro aminopeptidase